MTTTAKLANHRTLTIWLSNTTIAAIDAKVAEIDRTPGTRVSRNAWMVDALRAALARTDELSTGRDGESSIGPGTGPLAQG